MKTSDTLIAPVRGMTVSEPDSGYAQWVTRIAMVDERALAAFYDATVSRVYGFGLRTFAHSNLT